AAHRRQGPRGSRVPAGRGAHRLPPPTAEKPRYHRRRGGSGRMAILSGRNYGDPALRRRAAPVEAVTPDVRKIIADMVETLYDEVGLGLAAPQVGVSLGLMVVADEEGRGGRALIMPGLTGPGGESVAEERCLSV